MSIRAAVDIENDDLILTVDREGLEKLVDLLTHPASGAIPTMPGTKYPMTRLIGSLNLRIDSEDLVAIETDEEAASIAGNRAALARLAREISRFAEYNDLYEPGMHTHVDPGEPSAPAILGPTSRSLVIAGPVPDEPAPDP
jgi:hypothetical protein